MFITLPHFEVPALSAVAGGGQRHWKIVIAEFPVLPWYLFVYEGEVLGTRVPLAALVAWEESLLEFIDRIPAPDRRAVYRLARQPEAVLMRPVHALWAPEPSDGPGIGAILAMEAGGQPMDPWLHPVEVRERRLVFASTPASGPAASASSSG